MVRASRLLAGGGAMGAMKEGGGERTGEGEEEEAAGRTGVTKEKPPLTEGEGLAAEA